jgi:hypothetical protein
VPLATEEQQSSYSLTRCQANDPVAFGKSCYTFELRCGGDPTKCAVDDYWLYSGSDSRGSKLVSSIIKIKIQLHSMYYECLQIQIDQTNQ